MNDLLIKIEAPDDLEPDKENDFLRGYDNELGDIRSVLSDICDVLANNSSVKFKVSGFGQDPWPVDVRTDLATAVEELGEFVKEISYGNYNFEWYLYEQGIERRIDFIEGSDGVTLKCESFTDWRPFPSEIKMGKDEIKELFYTFMFSFCSISERVCPNLSGHPWFKEWSGVVEYQ